MAQALFRPAHQYDTMNLHRSLSVEGVVGRMLTLLLCKSRPEDGRKVDQELVSAHAQLLMKNSIEEIAKNMSLFEQIFVGTSWKHLAAVFDQ
ncbi:hypothetical protein OSTOST_14278, partial [Ostertagia ostertagi]